MLTKRCSNCEKNFSFAFLMKQGSFNDVICPHCKVHLRPTGFSKVIFTIICIVPLIALRDSFSFNWVMMIAWVLACIFVLQPFVYKYELNEGKQAK